MAITLSLSKRLLINNALYGIPVVVLMFLMIGAKNKDIDFAGLEKVGNQYQSPLETLLEHVSHHKLVAQRALNGDGASKSTLSSLDSQIDSDFSALADIDKKIGVTLQFTDEGLAQRKRDNLKASTVSKKWADLKSKLTSLKPSESNEQHTSLISDIRGMITHVGDTSNLILDPDLDSYYLTDVTLNALPQIQDRLQEITGYVEAVVRRGSISQAERLQIGIYAALLKSDLDHVTGSSQTSMNEDKNFNGVSETLHKNVPPITATLSTATEAFIGLITKISTEASISVSADQFVSAANSALAASFRCWWIDAKELDQLFEMRIHTIQKDRNLSISLGFIAMIFASLVSFLIIRSLNRNITNTVAQLTKSAEATSASSVELAECSQKLSESATEQAAAIQETVSTLDEINAMVTKSLDNAKKSAVIADNSQISATQGKRSVEDMIHAIEEINGSNESIRSQIESSNQQFSEIIKIITEIADKTKVINDIVFQTKLLSFNASVEAARAGEHGKGFAVVAEEVGNLAQMSGNAAKEISEMLSGSIQKVESIVKDTTQKVEGMVLTSKTKVDAGIEIAQKCNSSLEEIVQTVSNVNSMVAEITQAAQEQARGVDEITKAMQQLDVTTQTNTSMAQSTAGYADEVSSQSTAVRKIITGMEEQVLGKSVGSPETSQSLANPSLPAQELKNSMAKLAA
jgi:methyl-accepting chemotaxis protein